MKFGRGVISYEKYKPEVQLYIPGILAKRS